MASGPRRLNFVTLLLFCGFAAGGYWMWKFFPAWYTAWQVDSALADGAARTYQSAHLVEPNRSDMVREIERATRDRVVALGVDDPELALSLRVVERTAVASCDYTVVVQHPLVNKQSVMRFHRTAQAD